MEQSPIERWMRCEISTAKCAELLGMRRPQLEAIVNPMLFAVEAAVKAIDDSVTRDTIARALLAQMPIAADVLPGYEGSVPQ